MPLRPRGDAQEMSLCRHPSKLYPLPGRGEKVTHVPVTVHGVAFDPSAMEGLRPHTWTHQVLSSLQGLHKDLQGLLAFLLHAGISVGSWHRAGHTPRHPVPSSAGCWSTPGAGTAARPRATHGRSPGQRQEHDPNRTVPRTSPGPEAGAVKGPV